MNVCLTVLSKLHIYYVERKHVFRFVVNKQFYLLSFKCIIKIAEPVHGFFAFPVRDVPQPKPQYLKAYFLNARHITFNFRSRFTQIIYFYFQAPHTTFFLTYWCVSLDCLNPFRLSYVNLRTKYAKRCDSRT